MLEKFANSLNVIQLIAGNTGVEVLGTDQFAQRKVALQAGAGRADTENTLAIEQTSGLIQCGIDTHAQFGALGNWLARTILAVDVAITETAPVAQEVMVYRAVVAVLDAANFAIALARADVAAGCAAVANTR